MKIDNFEVETLEVSGFISALKALRLPYNKTEQSDTNTLLGVAPSVLKIGDDSVKTKGLYSCNHVTFHPKDIELMQNLIKNGDEHAKPVRGILVYASIFAPIDWWVELETYEAGHQRLFSSSTQNTEGKKLTGHELRNAKNNISYGRCIQKIDYFSYQTLRRIVEQRYNHRLPEWHFFIEWVKSLPMADELILLGMEEKLKVHDQYMEDYRNLVI